MPAKAFEQISAGREQARKVVAGNTPSRAAPRFDGGGEDDRRHAVLLRQAPCDEPDDAHGPRAGDDDDGSAGSVTACSGAAEGDAAFSAVSAASAVRASASATAINSRRTTLAAFQLRGESLRFRGIVGEQEARCGASLPHPADGVDARRDGEADLLHVDAARVQPGRREQCRDPRPRTACDGAYPQPEDRPVLAADRHDVGDRADAGQVRQPERERAILGRVRQEQLGKLEGDARAGQARVRVVRVRPVRVDDRARLRQDCRHGVVIGHQHIDAGHDGTRRSRRRWWCRSRP